IIARRLPMCAATARSAPRRPRRLDHDAAPPWTAALPRPTLKAVGRTAGRPLRPRFVDHHQEAPMNATDLSYTPALELGKLYRAKKLSPVEVTDTALARIERLNPKLNAYLTVTADHARELARAAEGRQLKGTLIGPLDGIPYSIKDLEPTAGIRTTYGSKFFEHNVPAEDGAVASRLRGSGGILLGKTNTPHFGYKDMCDNLIGPPCKNPWNLA